jgi:hypothetical protein
VGQVDNLHTAQSSLPSACGNQEGHRHAHVRSRTDYGSSIQEESWPRVQEVHHQDEGSDRDHKYGDEMSILPHVPHHLDISIAQLAVVGLRSVASSLANPCGCE